MDGVAVVSDIMASPEPAIVSNKLCSLVKAFHAQPQPRVFSTLDRIHGPTYTAASIKKDAGAILDAIRKFGPLVHQVIFRYRPSCVLDFDYSLTDAGVAFETDHE